MGASVPRRLGAQGGGGPDDGEAPWAWGVQEGFEELVAVSLATQMNECPPDGTGRGPWRAAGTGYMQEQAEALQTVLWGAREGVARAGLPRVRTNC